MSLHKWIRFYVVNIATRFMIHSPRYRINRDLIVVALHSRNTCLFIYVFRFILLLHFVLCCYSNSIYILNAEQNEKTKKKAKDYKKKSGLLLQQPTLLHRKLCDHFGCSACIPLEKQQQQRASNTYYIAKRMCAREAKKKEQWLDRLAGTL